MANWSRVFNYGAPVTAPCSSSCYNFTSGSCGSPQQGILEEFPLSVTSVSEAFNIIGERIRRRLGASEVFVMSRTDSDFEITLRFGNRMHDVGVISLRLPGGNFPISCTYTRGSSSGYGSFTSTEALVTFLADRLEK